MDLNSILIEERNNILVATLNRPEALNALNQSIFDDLRELFGSYILSKPDLRAIILTGSGNKAFAAGADIKEFKNYNQEQLTNLALRGQEIFFLIERCPIPVICAINGYALGGGLELAMSCHIRYASVNAMFGQPEVNLGLTPGYAGTQRLPRLIGRSNATEMLVTGNMIDAENALRLGLISQISPSDTLMQLAEDTAKTIAQKAPIAVKKTLECIDAYYDKSINGFKFEAEKFGECANTADFQEGTSAFIEKRKPNFTNQ